MVIKIFDYKNDGVLIDSFLHSASLAHKENPKDIFWFDWKFRKSPYGEAIIACSIENNIITGCVAFGIGKIMHKGNIINCALSYETFVHPLFQGKGLFKKLISYAEEEAINRGCEILYNFPNKNSLPGFLKMNWVKGSYPKYKIKINRWISVLTILSDIRKPFVSAKSNFESNKIRDISFTGTFSSNTNPFSIWNSDYIKWRFFTFPNGCYEYIDNPNIFVICRIGNRGKINEMQLLGVIQKKEDINKQIIDDAIIELSDKIKPDIISLNISEFNPLYDNLTKFLTIPSHTQFTYKYLGKKSNNALANFNISGIDYHTY